MTKEDIVFPGEVVASAEEFMPGKAVYLDGDVIRALIAGVIEVDREDMTVSVQRDRGPTKPDVGDIVLGEIVKVTPKMVKVKVLAIDGLKGEPISPNLGNLHPGKAGLDTGARPGKAFKAMEIVRARVVQATPSLQLATDEVELGTVKAYCSRCRDVLSYRNGELHCSSCGRKEDRKVADNYLLEFGPSA